MNTTYNHIGEMAQDWRRELEHRKDDLIDQVAYLDEKIELIENVGIMIEENRKLHTELDETRSQLDEERRKNADLEMKMAEMSKLSAGVAKKTSQDDFEKALRIFLNISKRKTVTKREAAKTVITEMLTSAKLDIPDDIRDMLDHLDDDQSEAKVVNVQGNYNDFHDNGTVNQK